MVGDDEGVRAFVDRAARIVPGVNALDDDRSLPRIANPPEVGPRHHRLRGGEKRQRQGPRAAVQLQHRPLRRAAQRLESGAHQERRGRSIGLRKQVGAGAEAGRRRRIGA